MTATSSIALTLAKELATNTPLRKVLFTVRLIHSEFEYLFLIDIEVQARETVHLKFRIWEWLSYRST